MSGNASKLQYTAGETVRVRGGVHDGTIGSVVQVVVLENAKRAVWVRTPAGAMMAFREENIDAVPD